MESRVFSFSVKTESDEALVRKAKLKAARAGQNFSWVVLQALKHYEATKGSKNEPTSRQA